MEIGQLSKNQIILMKGLLKLNRGVPRQELLTGIIPGLKADDCSLRNTINPIKWTVISITKEKAKTKKRHVYKLTDRGKRLTKLLIG